MFPESGHWIRYVAILLACVALVQAREPLRFSNTGSFKLMFITDLHMGESEFNDQGTQRTIQALLELEKPDFVVLGGDTFSNYATTAPSPKPIHWVQTQWRKAVSALDGKTEWAVVLGNHDQGTEMDAFDLMKYDATFQGSRSVADENMGDYSLPIFDSSGKELLTRLFMFNSQSAGLDPAQVDGYKERSLSLEKSLGHTVPSLAFMHIPLKEVSQLYNDGVFRGKMMDRDGVCYQATDLFSALKERDEVKIITFGHDHGNDFVGEWQGIQLAYGKKTGESAYNQLLENQVLVSKGARIFQIGIHPPDTPSSTTLGSLLYTDIRRYHNLGNELYNFSIHSWIRTADGVIDEQRLVASRAYSRLYKNCTGPMDPLLWIGIVVLVLVVVSVVLMAIIKWRGGRASCKQSTGFSLIQTEVADEKSYAIQKLA